MNFKNLTIQKFLSGLMVLAILAPSFLGLLTPKKAEAQFTDFVNAALTTIGNAFLGTNAGSSATSVAISLKNVAKEIARQMLMVVAKRALAEMTKSTVNWINTGFHGAPLFLENPSSFFQDIAKHQIKDFIQITGYDSLKYPFGKQYALNIIDSYKRQLQDNAAYSLSNVTTDPLVLSNLRIDFYSGGWDTFLVNTQYPQNNPIGYDIIASREISQRIDGVFKAPAEKVNDALQQGLGFLSPEGCPSNPRYNLSKNEFNRPAFNFTKPESLEAPDPNNYDIGTNDPQWISDSIKYDQAYTSAKNAAYVQWSEENVCPGGLQKTTPGSVVGSQITKSLGTTQTQKELAAALGNSLGAIFDSLIAKFLGDGLNSLSNKINSTNTPADDFTYYGNSLDDSTTAGGNGSWTNQEIDLKAFKQQISGGNMETVDINGNPITKYVPGAIELTKTELALIDNETPGENTGMMQILEKTWPVAKSLDACIPGPNKGWEERLDEERDRVINSKLMRETASEDDGKVKAANGVMRDLRFAVASFKDWITTQMISALPNSLLFIDGVNEIENNGQTLKELTDKKREKSTALARLQSIERALLLITTQPVAGSLEEKTLIQLHKQYEPISAFVGSTVSVEDLRSQLDLLAEKLQNLRKLDNMCATEKSAAGWLPPLEAKKTYTSYQPTKVGNYVINDHPGPNDGGTYKNVPYTYHSIGTEFDQFCYIPIHSGYSHGEVIRKEDAAVRRYEGTNNYFTFRNVISPLGSFGFTDLPLVNGKGIYGDYTDKFQPVEVDIRCEELFRVSDQDYKHAGETGF